ncbi:MAG: zinc-binding dehydrogenase, partial [Candidatus Heimdallarchaeota archaeon]|nr:zinc-binding dehydrogenase [Candidatus Heimdallarchaeota archaeon]
MKATILEKYGGPDGLVYKVVPEPVILDNEVLVKITAAAVNHFDLVLRKGTIPLPQGLPSILGSDGAGIIEKIGSSVSAFKKGDRVLVTGGGYGFSKNGTYAEKIAVSASKVYRLPSTISFDYAAAAGLTFRTAWYALKTKGKIQENESLLIQGGSSGVGIAALQLAKNWGMWVVSTAGKPEKISALYNLGADLAINYRQENLTQKIQENLGNKKLDVILDLVGGPKFNSNLTLLHKGGRILTVGYLGGEKLEFSASALINSEIQIQGVNTSKTDPNALSQILKMIASKKITPIIDQILPLNKANEAHRIIETQGVFGKIL